MSNNISNKIDKINKIKNEFGKPGLRVLFIFKLLKSQLKDRIEKEKQGYSIINNLSEDLLNKLCMEKATELVELSKDEPTESDIKELLSKISAEQ